MIRKAVIITSLLMASLFLLLTIIALVKFPRARYRREPWHIGTGVIPRLSFDKQKVLLEWDDLHWQFQIMHQGLSNVVKDHEIYDIYMEGLFWYQRHCKPDGTCIRVFSFQPSIPFILFSIYPTIVFFRGPYRRYRRRKKGLCLKCGYNLTGNVSGVCPECGEKI